MDEYTVATFFGQYKVKNEYVLTDDEVESFSPNEIKKTFNKFTDQYPKNNNY